MINIIEKIIYYVWFYVYDIQYIFKAKALWSVLCRQDIDVLQEKIFLWLGDITDSDGNMKKQDIIAAVEDLNHTNLEYVLPSCLTLKNLEGFVKTLKSKKQKTSFSKVGPFNIDLKSYAHYHRSKFSESCWNSSSQTLNLMFFFCTK